jgi:hypothetical protein
MVDVAKEHVNRIERTTKQTDQSINPSIKRWTNNCFDQLRRKTNIFSMNNDEPAEILSDDEDDNEARLSCSLRWLISKAYPHGTVPDYLPCEHFFQNEHDERFLSPDIALVLLSGDLYIRAFQYITHQQDRFLTYDDIINYLLSQKMSVDSNLLKQDDPLNAHVHLQFIDHLMRLYSQTAIDIFILNQRFEKLQVKSVLNILHNCTTLNIDAFLTIWINGICEYMSNQCSERIPPVIDLRTALIDGTCLSVLVSYYDQQYERKSSTHELNRLRHYLNHYNEQKMTNIFPFTVKHLHDNIVPDLNLQAMLVDLFVLFEQTDRQTFQVEHEDEENHSLNKSNQTYSINGDDRDDDMDEFFIGNHHSSVDTGAILQTSTNHLRSTVGRLRMIDQ